MEIKLVSSRKWVKKFAIPSLLLVTLVLPVTTYALGLGGIKLNSALSEILDADIELVGATEADIEGLKIGLASRDAFLRAGIDRSSVINSVRFAVKKRPNGTYYVKVTSRRAIREPFLNFLMEMNWRNGRMLREYTLLLDPPGTKRQATTTATVQTPKLESKAAAEAPATTTPFVDVPEANPEAKPAVDPYIADNELFPKTDIKDAAPVADAVSEPEVMRAPEPEVIAPEPVSEPEPIVPADVVPEPEVASTPTDTSGESGEIKQEFKESGQAYETPFVDNAPADSDELFPRIALNPYDPKTKGDLTKPELTAEPVVPADTVDGMPPADSAQETAPEPRLAGEYDYGITSKGDNVWKIAEKLRQDQSVTIYQMMMAIQQSNPNAFVDGNVHRLKVGQVIRIEDPSILGAISKDAAAQQFVQQTAAWDEYRQRVAGNASTQPIVAGDVGQPSVASSSTPQAEIAVEAPDGQNLSTAGTSAAANNDVAQLQQELQRLSERADAERGKNSALNNRLKEMEAELADMQRSLSVKNDELAALQQQLSQQKNTEAATPAPDTTTTEAAPAPAEPAAEIALPTETEKAPEGAVVEDQPQVVESQEPVVPSLDTNIDGKTPETTTSSEPLEVPVTQSEQAEPAATPEQSAGFMDGIMAAVGGVFAALTGGALLFIAIPVVVIVLLIIVIMFLRRRRSADNFQESILTGVAPLDEQLDADASATGAPASETSSFLSDFAISGVGAIQSDDNEVDPLTEADVFMAYGRYEAAEDRLKDAVNQDPNRKELKVKLLELYNSTKNRAAFEATAEDLYASLDGNDNDPNWQKAVALGKQIAPDSPLFSNASVASRNETTEDILHATSPSKEGPDSQVMDIGLDTGVFNTSDFSALDEDAGKQEESADLDFNFEEQSSATDDANDGLDFQLDDADAAEVKTPDYKTEENNALDFSFDEPEADNDKMDNDPTMSMTMDGSGMNPDAEDENPTMSMTFDTEGLNLDDSSTDLDMDFGDESMELNFDASDAADMSLNTDSDEVSTKLDLARAYIDMGDSEGARSILDEVLAEGNTQQKQEAQQLVTQIG